MKKNCLYKLVIAFLFLLVANSANAYPEFVEQDIKILCGKYTGIDQYKNQNSKVSCEAIRSGYMYIYNSLQKPIFSDLAGVFDNFKKNTFQSVIKKDISKCNRLNSYEYSCLIGDMQVSFILNAQDQVLRTVVRIKQNSDTFKKMLESSSRANQQNETNEYKNMTYYAIAKASAKVDGKYIKTDYYNNEFIITFLNKEVNK